MKVTEGKKNEIDDVRSHKYQRNEYTKTITDFRTLESHLVICDTEPKSKLEAIHSSYVLSLEDSTMLYCYFSNLNFYFFPNGTLINFNKSSRWYSSNT